MMLDYLIADYAAENLDGIFVGAHSRVYDRPVVEKWLNVSSDFGWVLFGQGHPLEPPAGYVLFYAAGAAPTSRRRFCKRIATDREQPYTHYERKRTRNRWRFFDELHGPVYKTTYVRREYAVASDQGGMLQPIQEHSWDVTWACPTRAACRIRCSRCIRTRRCASCRPTSRFPPDRASPKWSAPRRATIRRTSWWAARLTSRFSRIRTR